MWMAKNVYADEQIFPDKKKRKTKRDELVMSSVGFVDTSTNTIFDAFP